MSCLGERLTALVDGELGHEERERALAHLAGCGRCRNEADQMRRLKGRLRGLSELPATDGTDDLPSGDFLSRLRSLPGSAGLPEPAEAAPEPAVPAAPVRPRSAA
ncbi:zf-HC2 domain-containing protein, partial [Actinomadura darangshiensis]